MTDTIMPKRVHVSCLIFVGLLGLLPVLGYITPRILAYMPGLFILFGYFATRNCPDGRKCWRASLDKNVLAIAFGVSALCALSSLWAINGDYALTRSLKIAMVLVPGAVLFSQMQSMKIANLPRIATVFSIGAIFAGLMLLLDLWLQSGPYFLINGPPEEADNLSSLNRSVIALMFFALIALYLLHIDALMAPRSKKIVAGILSIIMLAVLIKTHSQSAQMGALVAILVWFIFPVKARKAWIALGGILICAMLSAPWLAQYLYHAVAPYFHETGMMSSGYAAPRMEIWDMVSRKAMESPFIGYGLDATRHIEKFDTPMRYTPLDHVLHPHNFALQLWIEFGALGVLCASILTGYILRNLQRQTPLYRRFTLTLFLSLIAVAATSYGLWQGWWLGLFMLLASLASSLQPCKEQQS